MPWWAEHENVLAENQNGFRRDKSCAVTSDIKIGMLQNKFTLAASLNVLSVYNNIDYSILMNKLEKVRCPPFIKKIIGNWLYYRETEFVINSQESHLRILQKG